MVGKLHAVMSINLLAATVNPIGRRTPDVEVGAVGDPLLGGAEPPVVAMSCWFVLG